MDMVIFLSVGLVVGAVIGVLLGKFVFASASGDAVTVAGLTATNNSMLDQIAELKTQIESMREAERLRLADDNAVINKLEPVTLMLKQLGDTVRTMENERGNQYTSVVDALRLTGEKTESLAGLTAGLKAALGSGGSSNVRGGWGEHQMRRIIEAAGLVEHADFNVQVQVDALDDDDKKGRPDLVIHLPGDRHIIIDSKVPTNAYMEAVDAAAEGRDNAVLLRKHAAEVRKHMKNIRDRKYTVKLGGSADYVIMFVPSETILTAALNADPGLYDDALDMNIALVSPNVLFMSLKSIAFLWHQQEQFEKVHVIVDLGKALYTEFYNLAGLVKTLGTNLGTALNAYNSVVRKMNGGLLRAAKALPGSASAAMPVVAPVTKAVTSPKSDKYPQPDADAMELDVVMSVNADELEIFDEESTMDSNDDSTT
jgi:DNA recombination protein RmuC